MSKQRISTQKRYQVAINGRLDLRWLEWFDGLKITPEDYGQTILSGVIVDQASMHGALKKIHNPGLILILVNPQQKNI
ncbi:MAG: hypothetical protein AAGD96_04355 [Chloroflexota bacterium]